MSTTMRCRWCQGRHDHRPHETCPEYVAPPTIESLAADLERVTKERDEWARRSGLHEERCRALTRQVSHFKGDYDALGVQSRQFLGERDDAREALRLCVGALRACPAPRALFFPRCCDLADHGHRSGCVGQQRDEALAAAEVVLGPTVAETPPPPHQR